MNRPLAICPCCDRAVPKQPMDLGAYVFCDCYEKGRLEAPASQS